MIAHRQCHPAHAEISDATLRASAREGGRFNPHPAASGAGVNVAIFLDRLHAGSTVAVLSAEEFTL